MRTGSRENKTDIILALVELTFYPIRNGPLNETVAKSLDPEFSNEWLQASDRCHSSSCGINSRAPIKWIVNLQKTSPDLPDLQSE